jgi:hypothetical protein
VPIDANGFGDWSVSVGDEFGAFELDAYFEDPRACVGRADEVTMSPSGELLAFLASPQVMGQPGGQGRLAAPWNIYTLETSPDAKEPWLVVPDVLNATALAWTPDSARLLFSGTVSGRSGTWLVRLDQPEPRLLTSAMFSWIAVAPDGRRAVGRSDVPVDQLEDTLVILEDLPASSQGP